MVIDVQVQNMDFILSGLAMAAIAYVAYDSEKIGQKLGFLEGCEESWIPINLKGLERDLKDHVYGQKPAISSLIKILNMHYSGRGKTHAKPLVLSFHGMPGTGKSYVSSFIMKNMFAKGSKSKFVHFFSGTRDFYFNRNVNTYKQDIQNKVETAIKQCNRAVFIFDEIEKMPDGLLDALHQYTNGWIDIGVDYSKVLFIFLSNVGQEEINNLAEQFWVKGQNLDEIDVGSFQLEIRRAAVSEEGGLKSTKIAGEDIQYFIPFLPLTENDVVKCIEYEISNMGEKYSIELVRAVLEEVHFNGRFSYTGCKNLPNLIQSAIFYQGTKQHGSFS